jgi:hypothetical protein
MDDDELMKIKSLSRKRLFKQYHYLGEGAARMVFALDRELVMKIPKNSFGLFQNKIENYIYNNSDGRLRKYLCPILKFEPELLIARMAIPIKDDNEYLDSLMIFCGNITFYEEVLELCKKYYLSKDDVRATSSWGILDGAKVLIDYGCPSKQGHKFYKKMFNDY